MNVQGRFLMVRAAASVIALFWVFIVYLIDIDVVFGGLKLTDKFHAVGRVNGI